MLLIIAILLVLLLVLLTVPISVAFRLDRIKEINGHVIFYWLFWLVRFRIGIPGAVKAVSRHNKKPREKTKKRKQGANVRVVIARPSDRPNLGDIQDGPHQRVQWACDFSLALWVGEI